MLVKHLTTEQMLRWVDNEDNSSDSFYSFLEKLAIQARKVQGIHDTLKAIGQQSQDPKTSDKRKCNICGKTHGGTCYKSKVVLILLLKLQKD